MKFSVLKPTNFEQLLQLLNKILTLIKEVIKKGAPQGRSF